MTWKNTRTPETRCPLCDHKLVAACSATGAEPSPGDISICLFCASPLVFDDEMRVREMSPADFAGFGLSTQQEIRRHQRAVRAVDRRKLPRG